MAFVVSRVALIILLLLPVVSLANGSEPADSLAVQVSQLPTAVGDDHTITVSKGVRWTTVGIREHVGYEHLRRANPRGFSRGKVLIIGRHIADPVTADGIVLNIPELTLFYFQHGEAEQWYPVSVGMLAPRWHTITGTFAVAVKEVNPIWYRPPFAGGGAFPPGPSNPLGDRLIYLNIPYYGLHSTNDPDSIGRYVSHGCIRMFPPHMHQLFDLVKPGTPLIITYETIKVGLQRGTVYLAVYPDVYKKGTNSVYQARQKLAKFGLSTAITDAALKRQLTNPDGIARPIFGSSLPVTVNGVPLETPIGPTIRNGVAYLPLPGLAAAFGATISNDADTKTVRYLGASVTYSPSDGKSFTALDTLFVPVRAFVSGLGGGVTVGKRLDITIPRMPAP